MSRRKKKEVSLMTMTFYCGYLEKEVTVLADELDFEGWQAECDMCGGHGGATVSFQCKCGDNHSITLEEW